MLYFSQSTGGFYDSAIHGNSVPNDAVQITAQERASLMAAQSQDKQIVADENGRPIAVAIQAPSPEKVREFNAKRRDTLLQDAGTRIAPLQDAVDIGDASEADKAALLVWKRYRVDLNRVDLDNPVWPDAPQA